jgi:hypothetical protein
MFLLLLRVGMLACSWLLAGLPLASGCQAHPQPSAVLSRANQRGAKAQGWM